MKKSELKNYIRENIISTLSEDTDAEIEKTKELTSAIKDLEAAKKEAGIEEDATPKGEDFFYDYLDIGMSYLEGFGKKHSLDDSQLEKLGKKIVDQLYKGDVGKAYDVIVKRGAMNEDEDKEPSKAGLSEENIGLADLEEMGYDAGEQAFEKVKGMFKNRPDFQSYKKGYIQGFIDNAGAYGLSETVTEEDDKEPSKADLKKTKGLAKAKEELALLTREMKSLAKKYSKAEGEEKEKLVADLKKKTKLKKELEAIIDK